MVLSIQVRFITYIPTVYIYLQVSIIVILFMYRFEHLEHRDGSRADSQTIPMIKWYKQQLPWTMGKHYYIKTFLGEKDLVVPSNSNGDFYWTYHKYQKRSITYEDFDKAITNLRKFQLILITEYLGTSSYLLQSLINFNTPPKQILPHEVQAKRNNKSNRPASELLPSDDFKILVNDNIFDYLFYIVAKRIYLERLHCNAV